MKIALLLTGFLRSYKSNYLNLYHYFIKKYNPDIYCISWDLQEDNILINKDIYNLYNNVINCKVEPLISYNINKKEFIPLLRENDVFLHNSRAKEHGSYWANRLIDQWKLVNEGYKLIDNPNKYDIIFRLRYDILLHQEVFLKKNNSLNIPHDIGGWNFSDHMAYGNNEIMKIYCNLYNNIEKLYIDYNIDITHAIEMPKFYISKNLINWEYDSSIKYGILK
jgi:hypothetical protein